ncbi:MAG: NADH-quinone oxidoreductase subunit N [Pseudohongiellaceae bacterium]
MAIGEINFWLLLPMIVVTLTTVLLMLVVAWKRNHALACAITVSGLLVALISCLPLFGTDSEQVTPLIIVDGFSVFFSALMVMVAMFIATFSFPYLWRLNDQVEEFYLLLLLATLGAMVMVSSRHFVSAFLGIELLSISLYAMIAYPLHSREAAKFPLEAAVKYLVLSGVSSALTVFGIALLYAQTGSLEFVNPAAITTIGQGPEPLGTTYYVLALLMLTAGFAFKLSLVPFHLWTPDVYEGAPMPATAFLATIGKAAMFALLLRYLIGASAFQYQAAVVVFSLLAILSIIVGNLLALLQSNLKRILAYSSIAHMGYLLVAVIATHYSPGTLSIEAVTFYLVAYIIMSLGAFGVALVISSSEKEYDVVGDYQGLFWREPWLATILTAMLLSLAGIPLTVGFIGKFYLFMAGVEGALWTLLAALVLGSGIGLYYYLRIIYRMIVPAEQPLQFTDTGIAHLGSYGILALLLLALLVLGIYPTFLMTLIATVSASL